VKIKRYLDKDMRQVLRRVREDQGPDAVILSNRRVDGGIEVIAAVDYDEALVRHALGEKAPADEPIDSDALAGIAENDRPAAEPDSPPAIVGARLESVPPGTGSIDLAPPGGGSLGEMRDEIASLRGMLETQLSGLVWKDTATRDPVRAQIFRNLARLGIAPDVANVIVDRLEPIDGVRHLWQAPLATLAQALPVKTDRLLDEGGVAALIGPTGVGKTTTIAKIATRFAMQHDPDDIALVSADAFRIGAREHLAAFANIIGARVYSASDSRELTELLVRLRDRKLVLIDTEGRSQRDRDLAGRLAAWGNNRDRVRFYLTMSAATQEAALDESVRHFSQVPLEGLVVTKIDEAAQLGCVMSTMIRHDLPAVWLSDGQRIPEDLEPAALKKLWFVNRAVDCIDASQPQLDEQAMADNYSASVANG